MMRLTNHGLRVINPLEFAWTETDFNFDDAIELADSSDQRVRRALDLITEQWCFWLTSSVPITAQRWKYFMLIDAANWSQLLVQPL